MKIHELRTKRLLLRQWKDSDIESFVAMGQNEKVMKYFPSLIGADQSKEWVSGHREAISENGWGLWAAEELQENNFIGFIGIHRVPYELPFRTIEHPPLEIGWRLRPEFWNRGLATEGAIACLQFGLVELGSAEIISFTSILNIPSIRVMQKIGMKRDENNDFDHPRVEKDHSLCRHLLYRTKSENRNS
ncbi:MAG: GNAT family N-acetyltransferase [Ignavibacteriota bacterium]